MAVGTRRRISRAARRRIYKRDGFKCSYCGCQLSYETATLDHVRPVSKGGRNSGPNLVTSCGPCNRQKGDSAVAWVVEGE